MSSVISFQKGKDQLDTVRLCLCISHPCVPVGVHGKGTTNSGTGSNTHTSKFIRINEGAVGIKVLCQQMLLLLLLGGEGLTSTICPMQREG
jgi:hypothetical protein